MAGKDDDTSERLEQILEESRRLREQIKDGRMKDSTPSDGHDQLEDPAVPDEERRTQV